MKRLLSAPILALATLAAASLAPAAETQTIASFERAFTKNIAYKYLLSLPVGYDPTASKQWPVILFPHGSGERGTDTWKVAVHGPPKLIRGDVTPPAPAPGAPATPPPAPETPAARAQREKAAALLRANGKEETDHGNRLLQAAALLEG